MLPVNGNGRREEEKIDDIGRRYIPESGRERSGNRGRDNHYQLRNGCRVAYYLTICLAGKFQRRSNETNAGHHQNPDGDNRDRGAYTQNKKVNKHNWTR